MASGCSCGSSVSQASTGTLTFLRRRCAGSLAGPLDLFFFLPELETSWSGMAASAGASEGGGVVLLLVVSSFWVR